MNRRNFSINELILDPSFRRVVKGTASPEEIERWSNWMEASDKNRHVARQALREISGFGFEAPAELDFDKEWARLYKETVCRQNLQSKSSAEKDFNIRIMFRLAAAVLLVGLVGLSVYFYADPELDEPQLEQITHEETVKTKQGQHKTLKFINNTKTAQVVLNENSTLIYKVGLLQDQPVEIVLEGEAFFDVEKGFSKGHPAFSVTTPDGIIEDLGTEFLVTVKDNRSRVILQEGVVKVKTKAEDKTRKEVEISKGQLVEFRKSNILRQETVNSSFYTSWATGTMQFDTTRISAFVEYVQQRFDVEVILKDSSLADVTLEGAVYFKSLEGLLRSVSDITKIPVYQSQGRDTVYIGDIYNANPTRTN